MGMENVVGFGSGGTGRLNSGVKSVLWDVAIQH